MLDVVKVSQSRTGSLFRSDCFTYPSLTLTVFTQAALLFKFSTNQALFTECASEWEKKEKPGCLFGGCPTV